MTEISVASAKNIMLKVLQKAYPGIEISEVQIGSIICYGKKEIELAAIAESNFGKVIYDILRQEVFITDWQIFWGFEKIEIPDQNWANARFKYTSVVKDNEIVLIEEKL